MVVVELFMFILKIKINLSSQLKNEYNQTKIKYLKKFLSVKYKKEIYLVIYFGFTHE
jgi:hypothetical protein